jgi:serine/threonine protein phosphatase 1
MTPQERFIMSPGITLIPSNPKHIHYEANKVGKDYIVGDLHGCIDDLMCALELIKFNFVNDRLFSVGDLIDRGPHSIKTARLMYEPWMHPVRGNHEQLMIDTMLNDPHSGSAGIWFNNGGVWRFDHQDDELRSLARDALALPLVISVGDGLERFNIVHAELTHRELIDGYMQPVLITDESIDNWVFDEHDELAMLWGRQLIRSGTRRQFHDVSLSPTYAGHTIVIQPTMAENHIYIDTGAMNHHYNKNKSEANCLTIAEPNQKLVHCFSMMHRTIETNHIDTLLKFCQ